MRNTLEQRFDKVDSHLKANIKFYSLTKNEIKKLKNMVEECRIILDWYFEFASNILKYNKISEKQRLILQRFNFDDAVDRAYAPGKNSGEDPDNLHNDWVGKFDYYYGNNSEE